MSARRWAALAAVGMMLVCAAAGAVPEHCEYISVQVKAIHAAYAKTPSAGDNTRIVAVQPMNTPEPANTASEHANALQTPAPQSEQYPAELRTRADEIESSVNDAAIARLNDLDMSALQSDADRLSTNIDVRALIERLRAGDGLSAEELMRVMFRLMSSALRNRAPLMIALTACAALAGIASRLCGERGARLSAMACLCAAATLVTGDVTGLARTARAALEGMGAAVDALMPLIGGIMAALGAHSAASLLGGVATAIAGAGMNFGREYVVGLAMIGAALEVCASLSPRLKLKRAAETMRGVCGMLVGAALVITLGAIKINGSLGADVDGVSVRAAKYALDNLVPVVGDEIKDTVEVMTAGCLMAQSLLGSCGMLLIVVGAAQPALTLAAAYISYNICAAIAQALGGDKLDDMCMGLAKTLRTLTVAVVGMAAIMIMLIGSLGTAARSLMAA